VHSIIDFGFLQLVESESGRVPMIGVIPHTVCSSSEGLDLVLDESAD
jgi:hypothetical protein